MKSKKQINYHDRYFMSGNWRTKIWQTLIALLCWIILIIPIFVTSATYIAYRTHGRYGHYFWHYAEGFQELNFLMIFLAFSLGVIAVFCLAMGYIQDQRSQGLVDKWPLFDLDENRQEQERAEKFMTVRFGSREKRQSVRYYSVKPEQNLTKNQLRDIIGKEHRK